MASSKPAYKYCFVPGCPSATKIYPNKTFICVPSDVNERILWCQAVGRLIENTRGTFYCCEDHFNKIAGGKKFLNKGVLPRFNLAHSLRELPPLQIEGVSDNVPCVNQRIEVDDLTNETFFHPKRVKLDSKELCHLFDSGHSNALEESATFHTGFAELYTNNDGHYESQVQGSSNLDDSNLGIDSQELIYEFDPKDDHLYLRMSNFDSNKQLDSLQTFNESNVEVDCEDPTFDTGNLDANLEIQNDLCVPGVTSDNHDAEMIASVMSHSPRPKLLHMNEFSQSNKVMIDAAVITEETCGKIRNVIADSATVNVGIQVKLSDMRISENGNEDVLNTSSDTVESLPSDTNYSQPSQYSLTTTSNSSEKERQIQFLRERIYENVTKKVIEHDPLLFLGIPKDSMYIFRAISEKMSLPMRNIYLTMKKIRQNHTNATLAYDFGFSERHVGRIFSETVQVLVEPLRSPHIALQRCKLVCPVSVKGDEKCSEGDVRHSRQISSCRIHIERVIERIREFRFLNIHSTVDSHYLSILDDIVVIVCGLVNIQGRISKQ
ncbi:hypothetical protein QAD02_013953 [Eretmocerus hayati]|uniref:Uncharacterized protein n=1 Tax=Eretmocerus hayati TaxID=131215 RepID=A0ACC2P560_9HYME|nr:hypothetical protein QAD02_013953 [Eretmocerus hayati]